jgi:hypothetical protein
MASGPQMKRWDRANYGNAGFDGTPDLAKVCSLGAPIVS